MAKLRRINYRNQITLPPDVLRDAGISQGGLVSIESRGGKVILEPKVLADRDFDEQDWSKLDLLVRRQVRSRRFVEYASPEAAKAHLRRRSK